MRSREFTAAASAYCANDCRRALMWGQLAVYEDGELMHAHCTPRRPATVCTTCWLEQPCQCQDGD